MRIALFSDTFFPDKNGVASAVYHLANLLAQAGQKVLVVAPRPIDWEELHHDLLDPRVELLFSNTIPLDLMTTDGSVGWLTPSQWKKVEEFAPDVVHVNTPTTIGVQGLRFAHSISCPVILHMHTNYYHPDVWRVVGVKNEWLAKIGIEFAWLVTKQYARQAVVLITPTHAFSELLAQKLPQKIVTIPYPLEKVWLTDPQELRKDIQFRLVYVGRLGSEKRVDLALKAFARAVQAVPQLRFTIVGDGLARRSLEQLSQELGVSEQVTFTGPISRDRILEEGIYRNADWFISMSTFETLGYTFIEAMAQGTPVLARSCAVNTEVVGDGGKVFAGQSEEEVIEEMALFLKESYIKKDLPVWRKRARLQAEHFSEGAITNKFLKTCQDAIKGTV